LRTALASASIAAALLGLAACGSSSDDDSGATASSGGGGSSETDQNDLKVGYSSKGSDQFQLVMQEQTIDAIEAAGLDALQPTTSNSDAGKQITDIRNLVSGGANSIIVAPGDSAAIAPAINFLNEKKIPVVALDSSPSTSKVAITVRTDNVQAGQAGCEKLGEWLDGKGTVLALQGDYNSESGMDRGNGFLDCMKSKFPDIKVVDRHMDWKTDKCSQIASTELKADKSIKGIYMASETICMAPVLSALKSSGRTAPAGDPNHVYTIGIDGSPFALQMVREGKLDGDLSQPLNLYAKYGVEYLQKAAAGETFKAGPSAHDTEIVQDGENLIDLLPVTFVDKSNASSKELWGNQVKK
jgi:ABC-type sugar transport system substrate-binding protein